MNIPQKDLRIAFDILRLDERLGRMATASDLEGKALSPSQIKRRKAMVGKHSDPAIAAIYSQIPVIEDLLGEPCQVDHITPISAGGKHEASNLQIVPTRINIAKSDKLDFTYTE